MSHRISTNNIRYTSKHVQVRVLDDFTMRGKDFKVGETCIVEGYVGYVSISGTIFTSFEYAMLVEQRKLAIKQ